MSRPLRLRRMSSGRMRRGGKPKKEWMVWPPTLTAASPVGASTTISSASMSAQAAQQRRLAGAGAAGDEQVAVALAQVVVGGEVLVRGLDARRP